MILGKHRSAPKGQGSHEGAPMRRMSVFHTRSRTTVSGAVLAMAVTLGIAPAAPAAARTAPAQAPLAAAQPGLERPSEARLIVPDQAAFRRLVDAGLDLTGHIL